MNFLTGLITKFGGTIATVLAGIAGIFGLFYAGKKSGESAANLDNAKQKVKDNEQQALKEIAAVRDSTQQQVDTISKAKDVSTDNSQLSDADVLKRLHDKYSRD